MNTLRSIAPATATATATAPAPAAGFGARSMCEKSSLRDATNQKDAADKPIPIWTHVMLTVADGAFVDTAEIDKTT